MADDEQFSLCWNNFNTNLSAGFHESLCRGDLVDVTLAAEGQFVKAHRLVLSVCSPYFRKMFTQMPANQHAFVFLKDVSHSALKDLIQFMYCGEVNVKQEALPAFISTAEALQIKGLTDSDPPQSQTPPEPSTPITQVQQMSSPRVRQRNSNSRSYKLESLDDSASEESKPQTTQIVIQTTAAPQGATIHHAAPQPHHLQTTQTQQIVTAAPATATTTVLSHKRPAQRNSGAPHIKRTKSTIETMDSSEHQASNVQTQQITVQTAVVTSDKVHQPAETEYIALPIDLPTKSEPEYAEEAGDVESGEQEPTYVEDDSYGDIRYDESYFTENEDGQNSVTNTVNNQSTATTSSKALVKQQAGSFSDSSYVDSGNAGGDQVGGEAQASGDHLSMIENKSENECNEKTTETEVNKYVRNLQENSLGSADTEVMAINYGSKKFKPSESGDYNFAYSTQCKETEGIDNAKEANEVNVVQNETTAEPDSNEANNVNSGDSQIVNVENSNEVTKLVNERNECEVPVSENMSDAKVIYHSGVSNAEFPKRSKTVLSRGESDFNIDTTSTRADEETDVLSPSGDSSESVASERYYASEEGSDDDQSDDIQNQETKTAVDVSRNQQNRNSSVESEDLEVNVTCNVSRNSNSEDDAASNGSRDIQNSNDECEINTAEPKNVTKFTPLSNEDENIPLHSGSEVTITKKQLREIYISNAAVYVSRLSDAIFGKEVLENVARSDEENKLILLDKEKLKAIIIHVVQAFTAKGIYVNDELVLHYLDHKLSNLAKNLGATAAGLSNN